MRDQVGRQMQTNTYLRHAVTLIFFSVVMAVSLSARAADQTSIGVGNGAAAMLASRSPLVRSAYQLIVHNAYGIRDELLRNQTTDALTNSASCIAHRAFMSSAVKESILRRLKSENLVSASDDGTFPGGLSAGVFPPVVKDGQACPTLPQPFFAAPGSSFGGHHSQPGGLAVHEALNDLSSLSLRDNYQSVYGTVGKDGLPVVRQSAQARVRERDEGDDRNRRGHDGTDAELRIDRDLMLAAPLWHDWAKTIVFQWNIDGTEFRELSLGGNGTSDNYGAPGDSKTGAHHIIGLAETMKRGLSPEFVITQASAHSAPSLGNEYKVVNWLRAAAIMAQVDPVARGYLAYDRQQRLRLPAVRRLAETDLNSATPTQTNLLVEYVLHNLSDADFTFTGPAMQDVELILKRLAPDFGYDAADPATYNNRFRNPVLAFLSAERLFIIFTDQGIAGVRKEINKLRRLAVV
ncbi:MAG: hypothetical protein NVSMB6_13430 [Burkholderiaceae bacterium]